MSRVLKKNASGYGYNYTDLNSILAWLESENIEMYQTVEPIEGHDYIVTWLKYPDEEWKSFRGARVAETDIIGGKSNPAQALGACITYSRRYSIMMALGLGSDDDDAACLNVDFPRTEEAMIEALKQLCENPSKKTMFTVVKKKLGLDKPVKEMSYDEMKAIYQTLIQN